MPGRVLSVHVKPGQGVEAGERLLVLEAMKMENRLTAPVAGKVISVDVSDGDQVAEGALLVEIETESTSWPPQKGEASESELG